MILKSILIQFTIISICSSVTAVFSDLEWNIIPNVSEDGLWYANMRKRGSAGSIKYSGRKILTGGRISTSPEVSHLMTRGYLNLPEEAINEVLKIIGRENPDEELDCAACGYRSCREFASTVAKGLAIPEMCHTFNLRNKQEYIETLRQTNRKLAETKRALEGIGRGCHEGKRDGPECIGYDE